MNRIEFEREIKCLLERCENIDNYDFEEAESIIRAFKALSKGNQANLQPHTLEHVGSIEVDFESARKYKKGKHSYWADGMQCLRENIELMGQRHTFE